MEFIVEKIGMSRTISVPSVPVTLLKVQEVKVCEVGEDGRAIVAYASGKKRNKAIEGTLKVANSEAGDLDLAPLSEAKKVKTTFTTKGRGFTGRRVP